MEILSREVVVPPPFEGPTEVDPGDTETIAELYRLRAQAWATEGINVSAVPDDHASHARHWVIRREGSIVATARLCCHQDARDTPDYSEIAHLGLEATGPIGFLSRLGVSPEARGHRLSWALDAVRVHAALEQGMRCAWVHVGEHRLRSLLALGFREVGQFVFHSIWDRPTFVMQLELPS